jgi:hypothetical protein
MAHFTCEVVYRGIFQKNLAARICRGIVRPRLAEWGRGRLYPLWL